MSLLTALTRATPIELASALSAAQGAFANATTECRIAERAIEDALLRGDPLAERRARAAFAEADVERQRTSALLDRVLAGLGRLTAA